MPPYEKKLLEETARLAEENNKILRGMRNANRWARFFGFIKWLIIIGVAVGSFYYIKPYLSAVLTIYDQIGGPVPSADVFQNLLNSLDPAALEGLLKKTPSGSY